MVNMKEIIKIKCPNPKCDALISVAYQPGIENKKVRCPLCKNEYPFKEFELRNPSRPQADAPTQYPGASSRGFDGSKYDAPTEVTIPSAKGASIGRIRVQGQYGAFQLRPGTNVIGRKADMSHSDFQIELGDKRGTSREHIKIDVRKEGVRYFHYLSLYKERVNDTYHKQNKMKFGETYVLENGDVIKLPDVDLIFELPDNDKTII